MHAVKLDHPRVWRTYLGGERLDAFIGSSSATGSRHYPEEWIASVTEARNPDSTPGEGLSHTTDGALLRDLIAEDRVAMLGEGCSDLGVLAKIIDAGERLTVQVHPSKQQAQRLFDSQYGKTECWYFLDAGNSSLQRDELGKRPYVYCGFKKGITRDRWESLFKSQDIVGMLACLNRIEVTPGMVILIRGGMPHAIGDGCFLIEIQEPTDYTIRIERTTPSGQKVPDESCHQGLGFARMFDCFDYRGYTQEEILAHCVIEPSLISKGAGVTTERLIGYDATPCFSMSRVRFNAEASVPIELDGAYRILFVTSGSGLYCEDQDEANGQMLGRGDQLFVPASACNPRVTMTPGSEVLLFHGPASS